MLMLMTDEQRGLLKGNLVIKDPACYAGDRQTEEFLEWQPELQRLCDGSWVADLLQRHVGLQLVRNMDALQD